MLVHNENLIAIIIDPDHKGDGIEFFTPHDFSQQIAYMNRPEGYEISPHIHNHVERTILHTQETLFIKSGRVRIDFFDDNHVFITSRILKTGHVILLAHGGHGLMMLEPTEIIEVKQGPYIGTNDKFSIESENLELYETTTNT